MQHHRGATHRGCQVGEAGVVTHCDVARVQQPGDQIEPPAGRHRRTFAAGSDALEQGLLAWAPEDQHGPSRSPQRSADRGEALGRIALGGKVPCPGTEHHPALPPGELAQGLLPGPPARSAEREVSRLVGNRRQPEQRQRTVQVVALVVAATDREGLEPEPTSAATRARQSPDRGRRCQEQLRARAVTGGKGHLERRTDRAAGPGPAGARRARHHPDTEATAEGEMSLRQQERRFAFAVGTHHRPQRRQRVHQVTQPVG
ncbi:MAG: hypothetical protein KA072_01295 [Thermoanaerobaculaceae bacterium]|nr:hypothetical protein [Thermoanaerobaculaceae bacterium]MDI9622443.1 hypothetical protein [Acidobacteriota bacterium]NLH11198.1 hypothetical protein [Holophagae bacterium]HPW54344.1 hypothetical protein [Thermoanaerobaculaceae bacterium]